MSQCDATNVIKMINSQKKSSEPLLKKRINQWSHEIRKVLSTCPNRVIPLFYGDRFIPRRFGKTMKDTNEASLFKGSSEDFLMTQFSSALCMSKGLKVAINKSFGIKKRRLLEFSDLAAKFDSLSSVNVLPTVSTYEVIYGNLTGLDWPCVPRVKPIAHADTTHDLPNFDMFSDLSLIDWSVDGQIAASFGRDLVLWKPSWDMTLIYKIRNSTAIAFCPNAEYLAIGSIESRGPMFELWESKFFKELYLADGYVFENSRYSVSWIEWSSSGKTVVCGTELGWVYVFSVPELKPIKILKDHKQPVFMIKFSLTMRYLATSDVEGSIFVYNWPSYDMHVVLRSKCKLRVVIDWHPWNGTDLAISEDSPASIVILNVPSREIVAYYQRKDRKIEIDFITFSKITGELLVSYSDKDSDGCIRSKILVMSSLDRVVDVICLPGSCARFMMWSPNGMQLVTAGHNEDLTIWNFLPNHDRKPKKNRSAPKRRRAKIDQTLDLWNCGKEFNKYLNMR